MGVWIVREIFQCVLSWNVLSLYSNSWKNVLLPVQGILVTYDFKWKSKFYLKFSINIITFLVDAMFMTKRPILCSLNTTKGSSSLSFMFLRVGHFGDLKHSESVLSPLPKRPQRWFCLLLVIQVAIAIYLLRNWVMYHLQFPVFQMKFNLDQSC